MKTQTHNEATAGTSITPQLWLTPVKGVRSSFRIYSPDITSEAEAVVIRVKIQTAYNQHEALLAVAEAAKRMDFADCNCNSSGCRYCDLKQSLAQLTSIQKGQA